MSIRTTDFLIKKDDLSRTKFIEGEIGLNELKSGQVLCRVDKFAFTTNNITSKGQACLRSSPLGKRFGWGVHNDEEGKTALYAVESDAYRRLADDAGIEHTKAMRSKRL